MFFLRKITSDRAGESGADIGLPFAAPAAFFFLKARGAALLRGLAQVEGSRGGRGIKHLQNITQMLNDKMSGVLPVL